MGKFDFIYAVKTNDHRKDGELYTAAGRLLKILRYDLEEYCKVIFDSIVRLCGSVNEYTQKYKKMHPESSVAGKWYSGLKVEFEKDNMNMVDIVVFVVQLDDLDKADEIDIDYADPFTTLCHIKIMTYDIFFSALYTKKYGDKSWNELVGLIGQKIFSEILCHSHCINSFTHFALEKIIDKHIVRNKRGWQNVVKFKHKKLNPKKLDNAAD